MAETAGAVDRLIDAFGRLPGLGTKSAERLAYHLLKAPAEEALALAEAIRAVKESVRYCEACYHLTEADQPLCVLCRDPRRNPGVICVVEQSRDLLALEKSGTFGGLYHVLLGRLAPAQGVGPDQLTVNALVNRVRTGGVRELIMATNPTLEGDGTASSWSSTAWPIQGLPLPGSPEAWPRAASWNSRTRRCWPTLSTADSGFNATPLAMRRDWRHNICVG